MWDVQRSGGLATSKVESEGLTLGAQLYGEFAVAPWLSVGLGVPAVLNAPGPTSNAYEVGLSPRARARWRLADRFEPFVVIAPRIGWERLPQQVWWRGFGVAADCGLGVRVSDAFWLTAAVGFERTAFAGEVPPYSGPFNSPSSIDGSVGVSYVTATLGFEVRL
jgi:hypothetical protein